MAFAAFSLRALGAFAEEGRRMVFSAPTLLLSFLPLLNSGFRGLLAGFFDAAFGPLVLDASVLPFFRRLLAGATRGLPGLLHLLRPWRLFACVLGASFSSTGGTTSEETSGALPRRGAEVWWL